MMAVAPVVETVEGSLTTTPSFVEDDPVRLMSAMSPVVPIVAALSIRTPPPDPVATDFVPMIVMSALVPVPVSPVEMSAPSISTAWSDPTDTPVIEIAAVLPSVSMTVVPVPSLIRTPIDPVPAPVVPTIVRVPAAPFDSTTALFSISTPSLSSPVSPPVPVSDTAPVDVVIVALSSSRPTNVPAVPPLLASSVMSPLTDCSVVVAALLGTAIARVASIRI